MPTQIEIQPDVADKLIAIARTRGISIDALLREILNQLDKTDHSSPRWRLEGSIELLDEDLASGGRAIGNSLQDSLLEASQNL